MTSVLIITSSKYLSGLSLVELGHIPLAFRPLGVTSIYERIPGGFGQDFDAVFLTIPADFECPPHHLYTLRNLGITLVPVPDEAEVGTAIARALDAALPVTGEEADVYICYGDLLPHDPELAHAPGDFIAVHKPQFYHNWGVVSRKAGHLDIRRDTLVAEEETVCAGLFRFSAPGRLSAALAKTGEDWFSALAAYDAGHPLALLPLGGLIDLCGHMAYNSGRRVAMAPRSFNRLQWERSFILKRSSDGDKMRAEYQWFSRLPRKLQIHVPVTADFTDVKEGEAGYSIQYLPMQTISNLLIFGALPAYAWERILDACDEVLSDMHATFVENPAAIDDAALYSGLLADKTRSRVTRACKSLGISGDEPVVYDGTAMLSVNALTDLILARIPATRPDHLSIMHGDFCGSNLLFDASTGALKMIDPRGYYNPGEPSIHGDIRYDIAKLSHSVLGMYDSIIAGHADAGITRAGDGSLQLDLHIWQGPGIPALQKRFLERRFAGMRVTDQGIFEIMISLFLTMIPLHADVPARQQAFLANAYRLARDLGIGLAGNPAARTAEPAGARLQAAAHS